MIETASTNNAQSSSFSPHRKPRSSVVSFSVDPATAYTLSSSDPEDDEPEEEETFTQMNEEHTANGRPRNGAVGKAALDALAVRFSMTPDLAGALRRNTERKRKYSARQTPYELNAGIFKRTLLSLLACLYALMIVIVAFGFEIATVTLDNMAHQYDWFYLYLYLSGIAALVYLQVVVLNSRATLKFRSWLLKYRMKKNNLVLHPDAFSAHLSRKRIATHSAPAAGSLYLRLGTTIFAVIAVVNNILQILALMSDNAKSKKDHSFEVVTTAFAAVFTFFQAFFTFRNYKLSIHRQQGLAKFALIHLVATNLCVWIKAIVLEEFEALHELLTELQEPARLIDGAVNKTLMGQTSDVDTKPMLTTATARTFMTTCLIEYSVISAAVMFILWINVGYDGDVRKKKRNQIINIDCSSSSRGLFAGLMFGIGVIVALFLFFLKLEQGDENGALTVFFVSEFIFYGVSIIGCICAAVRFRQLQYYITKHPRAMLFDDILLLVALVGQLMFSIFSMVGVRDVSKLSLINIAFAMLRVVQTLMQTPIILLGQRLHAVSERAQRTNPGREFVTFLTVVNVALWVFGTFATLKASSSTNLKHFFNQSSWFIIVHSTVPLTIFYRFHSSVCLAEMWKNTYKNHRYDDCSKRSSIGSESDQQADRLSL